MKIGKYKDRDKNNAIATTAIWGLGVGTTGLAFIAWMLDYDSPSLAHALWVIATVCFVTFSIILIYQTIKALFLHNGVYENLEDVIEHYKKEKNIH